MKSIVISSVLTVGMVIAVVISSIFVSKTLMGMEQRIAEYDVYKEDFAEISEEYEKMLAEYRERSGFLSLLLADTLISEIENCFLDVIAYARTEDIAGVASSHARLHANIEGVRVLTEFSLRSIF